MEHIPVGQEQAERYLTPYRDAAEEFGAGFGALLWASPKTQRARFEAIRRACSLEGRDILDVGCGRADLLDYLLANGVPFADIVVETHSIDTEQQVHRLAAIAHENNLHHIVVVSDGTHLFRIRQLCQDAGLDVYTSPRPLLGHISNYDLFMRYVHEIISYTALRLNINVAFLHSWLEGKPEV